jgi:hypothetical protein
LPLCPVPQGDSNEPHVSDEKSNTGNSTLRQTAQFRPVTADLQRVIDAWSDLDSETRRRIAALVDGSPQC